MAAEILDRLRGVVPDEADYEGELKGLGDDDIIERLRTHHQELGRLHISKPINDIVYGALIHPDFDKPIDPHDMSQRVTPINCMASLLHSEEQVHGWVFEQIVELYGIVHHIALEVKHLYVIHKGERFDLPYDLHEEPWRDPDVHYPWEE